jgi:hypothetical protein
MMWESKQKNDETAAAVWSSVLRGVKELRGKFPPKDVD